MGTFIAGSGHHLPPRVVDNEELAALLGIESAWIEERSGIQSRHFVAEGESTSWLGAEAARKALADAKLTLSDVDAIIFATLSPDVCFPGAGVYMQRELGLAGIPALDVRNQCSGFLYGLSIADAWLRVGRYQCVLLVCAEVQSTSLNFHADAKGVSALFGDGGGAVVLTHDQSERDVLDIRLGADGRGAENLWLELPSSTLHPSISPTYLEQGRQYPQMAGRVVFRRAVETLTKELRALFEDHDVGDDVIVIPHQANRRINELVAHNLKLDASKVVHTIERTGNTTAASIPISIDIARRDGRIAPGKLAALAAFGSGFTWGTALLRT